MLVISARATSPVFLFLPTSMSFVRIMFHFTPGSLRWLVTHFLFIFAVSCLLLWCVKSCKMLILRGVVGMKAECLRVYSSIRTARSCLDVGKLVVRGVSRQSQPRQCLVGFHRVSSAHESCAVYLPSTQSSLVRPFSALSRCGCAFPVQMNASPVFPFLNVVRFRRRKMQRKPGDTPGDEVTLRCWALRIAMFFTMAYVFRRWTLFLIGIMKIGIGTVVAYSAEVVHRAVPMG